MSEVEILKNLILAEQEELEECEARLLLAEFAEECSRGRLHRLEIELAELK